MDSTSAEANFQLLARSVSLLGQLSTQAIYFPSFHLHHHHHTPRHS